MALIRGALAGAAGTTGLNAVTYLDMAVRGRPASDAPEQVVERSLERAGLDIPGSGDVRAHRREAAGPLSGIAVGTVVGAVAGRIHDAFARRGRHVPAVIAVPVIGAAAMALSDVPLALLGISDPRTWSGRDWVSDAVPHLVFGVVTYAALQTQDPRSAR